MTTIPICRATTTLTGQTRACLKPVGHRGYHRDREGFQWGGDSGARRAEVQFPEPPRTEPVAVIEQSGRRCFSVYVLDGISRWGPDGYGWLVGGVTTRHAAARAHRKARRVLRAYLLTQTRVIGHLDTDGTTTWS